MLRNRLSRHRRGTTAVEFAIAFPIVFFLLLATIVGGMGVFRYQQVAAVAREGARWACVHGGEYEQVTGKPAATPEDVFNKAILPVATMLRPENLSYSVTWDQSNMPLQVTEDVQEPFGNTVTVTVTYQWFPELFLIGPFTLTSSSTAQMIY
ncbi:MAG TPA: TadE/TadG family type IV pilus assembly protein [Pirellulales bacterium]|nr:TadE/TadG family type IV pilus assembly protein [Pirellulales bacterium]